MAQDYQLGIDFLDGVISFSPGTNLLMIGPALSGKDVLINHILYRGLALGEGGILVSTNETGEGVLKWFSSNGMSLDSHLDRFGIVDCISLSMGLQVGDLPYIKRVTSALNLTGISVGIMGFMEEIWMRRGIRRIRIAINSLSTILMYSNLQTLFRFLHVLTSRIRSANALGIFLLESEMHDEKTVNTVKQLMDAVLEIKEREGKLAIRCLRTGFVSTPWIPYRLEGSRILGT